MTEAHKPGIYVVLDIILHHAGNVFTYQIDGTDKADLEWRDEIPPIKWHEEGILPTELQRDEFYTRRGAAESAENGSHPNGDFVSLKAFDADLTTEDGQKPIQDILIKAHQYLIAKFDIDGFRIRHAEVYLT